MPTLKANNNEAYSCPHCNSLRFIHFGIFQTRQRYRCKNCHKTFTSTSLTPLHRLRKKQNIPKYLKALKEGLSVRKAAKQANISKKTAFNWRHKFLSSLSYEPLIEENTTITTGKVIKLKYSAKGRKKTPEKDPRDTQTILLINNKQLHIKKLNPATVIKDAVTALSSSKTKHLIAICPNRTLSKALKNSPSRQNIQNKKAQKSQQTKANKTEKELLQWMQRFRGVASKYLQQYWRWYATLSNTAQLFNSEKNFNENCISSQSLKLYYQLKEQ